MTAGLNPTLPKPESHGTLTGWGTHSGCWPDLVLNRLASGSIKSTKLYRLGFADGSVSWDKGLREHAAIRCETNGVFLHNKHNLDPKEPAFLGLLFMIS